MMLLLNYEQKV